MKVIGVLLVLVALASLGCERRYYQDEDCRCWFRQKTARLGEEAVWEEVDCEKVPPQNITIIPQCLNK